MLPQAGTKGCRHVWCTSLGLRLRQESRVQRFVSNLKVVWSCLSYLPVGSEPLISERNYPASSISKYSFFTFIEIKKLWFWLVYISQYTVIHNKSRFLRYYLGNKFRLDISRQLSVESSTTNRCEITPLTKRRVNTGNKHKRLLMACVKLKLVA